MENETLKGVDCHGNSVPRNCHHCIYYVDWNGTSGECHYYPPKGALYNWKESAHKPGLPDEDIEWLFPKLDGANFCSKWTA
jgi:hypothetical protein